MRCSRGSCIVVRVRLGGGVGVGVGAPIAENISAGFRMAPMVWAPKRAKGTAGPGFARASDRRLAESVVVLVEDIV